MGPFARSESGMERQITRTAVWRLRHGESLRDTELQGFGVEATDEGKLYFLETAIGGAFQRYVIGRHGAPWTPETARAEAWKLKAELLRKADIGAAAGSGNRRRQRRLTGSIVDSLKPGEIAWDNEVTGFGARCQRVSKVYFLKARIGRQQRWITIGKHGPDWSPEKARREARRLLSEIAAGRGPAAEEPPRRRITVSELCDRYLKEGCSGKSASTIKTDRGRIERHIKPVLGRKGIGSVTAADIERFVAAVATGETATDVRTKPRGRAVVTGGAGTATRTLGLLGGVFSFAVARGLLDRNPVRGVRAAAPRRGPRVPTAGELARLGVALATAERDGLEPAAIALFRLMVLTGCRSADLLRLTWADVDLERAVLRLPDESAGQRFVALSGPALGLLRDMARGGPNDPVIAGQARPGELSAFAPLWRRLKARAGLRTLRPQDFTHCFAALGPDAMERFLAMTPPVPQSLAPSAQIRGQSATGEESLPRARFGAVSSPPAARPTPPTEVTIGLGSATPSAALLAWRAKAEAVEAVSGSDPERPA